MDFILSLDQGTTSSRAILFDREARLRAVAQKEFKQHFPEPGWVEHDPEEIWHTQIAVATEVMAKARVGPSDLCAIGITNQRETTILWDRKTGRAIAPAIVWQDRRTAGICEQLVKEGHEVRVREKTGLVIDAYFSATKIRWLLDHVEGARKRAENGELAFGTVDSWLIWNLTEGGIHVSDISNASRTLLYDIANDEWDDELLSIFEVPRSLLPDIHDSSGVCATAVVEPFSRPVPISGVAGDQQAALFGQLCTEPGSVKCTYGTGCFILMNTGAQVIQSQNRLLSTVAWRLSAHTDYVLEGSVFMGGAAVQWLRDGLEIISGSHEVEALASSVEDTDGVFMVPAFTGLGAPYWAPYVRGAIVGLTRRSTRAHIARATLEGIAFQVADVVGAMQEDAGFSLKELRVDGGASNNDLLMQFQADLLGFPVVRPAITETTALGAAYLAGLATAFWEDLEGIRYHWQAERVFEPAISDSARTALLGRWRAVVEGVCALPHGG